MKPIIANPETQNVSINKGRANMIDTFFGSKDMIYIRPPYTNYDG
jgi:hypothetical protein